MMPWSLSAQTRSKRCQNVLGQEFVPPANEKK